VEPKTPADVSANLTTNKPKTIDSKTMDSNSPVPTAKDPNLPKQNTTSLSTQPGAK